MQMIIPRKIRTNFSDLGVVDQNKIIKIEFVEVFMVESNSQTKGGESEANQEHSSAQQSSREEPENGHFDS